MSEIEDFANALALFVPPQARLMMCSFAGDPNESFQGKWRARPYRYELLEPRHNLYFCVSAMKQNDRGEYRRRKENFCGGLCLMVDDIGYGKSAKFGFDKLKGMAPTALVETSPGNFQGIYMFDKLETDMTRMELLINGFIEIALKKADPGMAGVNRVFRPPYGINGKPAYRDRGNLGNGCYQVGLREADYTRRYPLEALARHFGVSLAESRRYFPKELPEDESITMRLEAFRSVRENLMSCGMIKDRRPDLSGWMNIRCPWTDKHSGGADNGASIRVPSRENDFYGGFRCHHGHCQGKGWRDLTEWVAEADADILNSVNASGWEFKS
jgi:RepB DNA-primase N-terminal domain